jgi:hypothetical protein
MKYIEYQSVCLFVGMGSPHPLPRKRQNDFGFYFIPVRKKIVPEGTLVPCLLLLLSQTMFTIKS